MKTKLHVSFIWYMSCDDGWVKFRGSRWDSMSQKHWFLAESGYASEDDATVALLEFVGDDVWKLN